MQLVLSKTNRNLSVSPHVVLGKSKMGEMIEIARVIDQTIFLLLSSAGEAAG